MGVADNPQIGQARSLKSIILINSGWDADG